MTAQQEGVLAPRIETTPEKLVPKPANEELNLLTLVRNGRADSARLLIKPKTEAEEAGKELSETISRLQTDPVEPGSSELAIKLAQSAMRGDVKGLETLLKAHLKDDAFPDALDQASDVLQETGIHMRWRNDIERLVITRYPSAWQNGPEAVAVGISGKGEKAEAYRVEREQSGKLGDDGSYAYFGSTKSPEAVAADLGKTATKALAEQRKDIQEAIESVKLTGAIEHAGGFNKTPVGKDEITPLATAFLEKRLSPLLRAVQAAKTVEERTKLAEALNSRLSAVGMHASYDAEEGFCVFTYSQGLSDGYSIHFPAERGGRIEAFELRGDKYSEPDKSKPAVLRILPDGKDIAPVPVSDAMRGFYRRLKDTRSARTF